MLVIKTAFKWFKNGVIFLNSFLFNSIQKRKFISLNSISPVALKISCNSLVAIGIHSNQQSNKKKKFTVALIGEKSSGDEISIFAFTRIRQWNERKHSSDLRWHSSGWQGVLHNNDVYLHGQIQVVWVGHCEAIWQWNRETILIQSEDLWYKES